jgi:RimJ/RimL family protein N-acetyltransferase
MSQAASTTLATLNGHDGPGTGRPAISDLWPLFRLRIRTERLELRPPDDELIASLAPVARRGLHDPERTPFGNGWTDRPDETWESGFAQYFWAQRARWTPSSWALPFAVTLDGELVGVQQITAEEFPMLRTFGTGSWVARAHQGRGIGTEMRAAVLHFGFAGLGGELAITGAYTYNPGSIRVSEKLGYEPNGIRRERVRDLAADAVLFRLTRAAWEAGKRVPVELHGVEDSRGLFGLDST